MRTAISRSRRAGRPSSRLAILATQLPERCPQSRPTSAAAGCTSGARHYASPLAPGATASGCVSRPPASWRRSSYRRRGAVRRAVGGAADPAPPRLPRAKHRAEAVPSPAASLRTVQSSACPRPAKRDPSRSDVQKSALLPTVMPVTSAGSPTMPGSAANRSPQYRSLRTTTLLSLSPSTNSRPC